MEENNNNLNLTVTNKNKDFIKLICIFILGILLGGVLIYAIQLNSKEVIKTNAGAISENQLFESMKSFCSIDLTLELVDEMLLNKKYESTETITNNITETADYYISMYKDYYGISEEEFLKSNGFNSYEDFINSLTIKYKRDLCYYDYLESLLEENAVQKYYDENIYNEINSKHILVQFSDNKTNEEVYKIAQSIIKDLNKGTSFEEVTKQYKEKYGDLIIQEDIGFIGFASNIEANYKDALKDLKDSTYSTTPVETSYGYHIIYRIGEGEKTSYDDARTSIIETLATDIIANDSTIYYKALIKFREENNLEFKDEDLQKKYKEYCETYN